MNNSKKIIKDISIYVGSGLLGLLLVFIILLSAFPDVSLNTLGIKAYIAKYDTMAPKINPYDLVFVTKVNPDELEEEDLITYYADINYDGKNELVTYYILDIDPANDTNVYTVHAEGTTTPATAVLVDDDIIAGYSFKLPKFGYVIEFIASPFGIAVIVVNAGIITAIVLLIKSNKEDKKIIKKDD